MSVLGKDANLRWFSIAPYNLKELANIYDCSRYKLRKRMKPYKDRIGEPHDGYDYDAEQVELTFALVKLPSNVRIIGAKNK